MEKKYLILGLKKSGKAACFFLLKQDKKILCFDDNLEVDDDIIKLKKNESIKFIKNLKDLKDFSYIEKIVISPGFNPNHEILKNAKKTGSQIIGEMTLGVTYLKKNYPKIFCIGITGTNGKTTLCKLLCHILNDSGIRTLTAGNIGLPITKCFDDFDKYKVLILEISSFQLETLKNLKFLDMAIITNITPDHLDRYRNFKEYKKTKLEIKNCLKNNKFLYTNKNIKNLKFLKNFKKINVVKDEIENIAEKICLDLKISIKSFFNSLKTFKKDPHRLEFVRKLNKISFYNDSKSTNIYSVIYAVNKINGPIILIAGGVDKKLSFKIWKKTFKNKVKKVIAIGKAANRIKKELSFMDVEIAKDLKKAILLSKQIAKENYTVLFSPGCSSFDSFKNYEHRGDVFKKIVNCL